MSSTLFAPDRVMQTFVVRLWIPQEPSLRAPDSLRGIVEHVGSGRSGPFTDEDQLLAFLRERLEQPVAARQEGEAV